MIPRLKLPPFSIIGLWGRSRNTAAEKSKQTFKRNKKIRVQEKGELNNLSETSTFIRACRGQFVTVISVENVTEHKNSLSSHAGASITLFPAKFWNILKRFINLRVKERYQVSICIQAKYQSENIMKSDLKWWIIMDSRKCLWYTAQSDL